MRLCLHCRGYQYKSKEIFIGVLDVSYNWQKWLHIQCLNWMFRTLKASTLHLYTNISQLWYSQGIHNPELKVIASFICISFLLSTLFFLSYTRECILMQQIIVHWLAVWLISYLPVYVNKKRKRELKELCLLLTLSLLDVKIHLQSACSLPYWKIIKIHVHELLSVQKWNLSCNSG